MAAGGQKLMAADAPLTASDGPTSLKAQLDTRQQDGTTLARIP
jgi:hypothetical protein